MKLSLKYKPRIKFITVLASAVSYALKVLTHQLRATEKLAMFVRQYNIGILTVKLNNVIFANIFTQRACKNNCCDLK